MKHDRFIFVLKHVPEEGVWGAQVPIEPKGRVMVVQFEVHINLLTNDYCQYGTRGKL